MAIETAGQQKRNLILKPVVILKIVHCNNCSGSTAMKEIMVYDTPEQMVSIARRTHTKAFPLCLVPELLIIFDSGMIEVNEPIVAPATGVRTNDG